MKRILQRTTRGRAGRRRRGLSTLEMVLCLPMLMFVMALMINFGTAACWKIRGLTQARCLAFASCWPKGSATPSGCNSWSSPQTAGLSGASDCSTLDDARCNLPVARGVLEHAGVYNEVLDPSRGFKVETASTTRSYPLLKSLGTYPLSAYVHLLDNKWQYGRQYSYAEGHNLPSNYSRRIPVIYALCKASSDMSSNYVTCVYAILRASFRTSLYPLDKDTEYINYNTLFHWGSGAPDFHPRFQSTCSLDQDTNQKNVDNLVDRSGWSCRRRLPGCS